ncbi:MAG: class I SAM-dependent methyltransferase [Candidatus Doudnabacteria bacterium]|nr:class I SAM-dependent methyltransferase [Candidatus Doudnabacteria bacterium]
MKHKTSFGKFAEFWDAKIGEDGHKMESLRLEVPLMLSMLNGIKNKRIYEVACGNGFLARRLAKAGAKEMVASDISPELIKLARTKYGTLGINYLVREGTDFSGIHANYFDAVLINQGIFYIEDLDTFFKGVYKVLKPGGILLYNTMHPLTPAFRKAIGEDIIMGTEIDILKSAKKYHQNYVLQVSKKWRVDDDVRLVTYSQYKRPLSSYINTAAKHQLFTAQIIEPPSRTKLGRKVKTSTIPSTCIIKAVKL